VLRLDNGGRRTVPDGTRIAVEVPTAHHTATEHGTNTAADDARRRRRVAATAAFLLPIPRLLRREPVVDPVHAAHTPYSPP
jgi:hypothetical protein